MKIKSIIPIVALATVSMTSVAQNPQSQQLRSGLDMSNMDNSVKPQDDFFHYACGGWMKKNASCLLPLWQLRCAGRR